jgi:hypothetical protein
MRAHTDPAVAAVLRASRRPGSVGVGDVRDAHTAWARRWPGAGGGAATVRGRAGRDVDARRKLLAAAAAAAGGPYRSRSAPRGRKRSVEHAALRLPGESGEPTANAPASAEDTPQRKLDVGAVLRWAPVAGLDSAEARGKCRGRSHHYGRNRPTRNESTGAATVSSPGHCSKPAQPLNATRSSLRTKPALAAHDPHPARWQAQ